MTGTGADEPARDRTLTGRFPLLRGGLRTRLVIVFLLVAVVSALTAATLTFRQARESILHRAQHLAVNDLRAQVTSLAPDLPAPPSEADLRTLTLTLDRAGGSRQWHTAAAYGNGPLVTAAPAAGFPDPPAGLRAAAADATTAFAERFHRDGVPWLAIAVPVTSGEPGKPGGDGGAGAKPSGLVVYATSSLVSQQNDVRALVSAARAGVLPVVALALVPALFAARRVLRPVRRLRTAAEKMSAGELDTRITVTGNDELADLSRAFNTMAATVQADDAALRAMEARSRRFAADVSHELRTPLAAMTAVTDVLHDDAVSGELSPDTSEALELVADETRKLTRMVEDLMEISRFDAGAAALHLDEIDVAQLIGKTLALRHWQDLVRVETPARNLRARVDPRRVDVILANLVGNALRHGDPHGPVRVRAAVSDDALVITVADNGPGIPDPVLPHVFDRFVKGDAARARSEGSGLGLAIAAENAHLHGGTLTAANGPSGGAVFTLTLPWQP